MRAILISVLLFIFSNFFVSSRAQAASIDPKLDACFQSAAKLHDVPVDLLKTIAQMETQGVHIIPDHEHLVRAGKGHSHMVIYGIMGLRNDAVLGTSLQEGAKLLGKSLDDLKSNPCTNIEAAAAILESNKALNLRGQTADFLPALVKFWNYSSAKEAKRALEEVNYYLENGFQGARLKIRRNSVLAKNLKNSLDIKLAALPTPIASSSSGEFPGSTWRKSSNYGEGALRQRYIVIHTTEGGFEGSANWLISGESGVSAHYIVRGRDGFTEQLVRERDEAYHVRCWNSQAIGIEMEGFLGNPESFTDALYDKVSEIVTYLADKYKIKKDNLHIIGHNFGETELIKKTDLDNCNDHSDPGKFFNWTRFFRLINPPPVPATPSPPATPPPATPPPSTVPPGKIPPWDFGDK